MAAAEGPVASVILFTLPDCVTSGTVFQVRPVNVPEVNKCVNVPDTIGLSYRAYLGSGAPKGKTCKAILYGEDNCALKVSNSGTLTPEGKTPAPCINAFATKSALVKCD